MLRFTLSSLSTAAALALLAPGAFAQDAATTAATSSGSTTVNTSTSETSAAKAMMRKALMENRERMKNRNLGSSSRGTERTIRRTQGTQAQNDFNLRVKDRLNTRADRWRLQRRVGSPNAGIRRQGIVQDEVRVHKDATRQPVGRMRLFPGVFEQ